VLAVGISLTNPVSALIVLAAVAPLVAFVVGGRRAARVAGILGLPPESQRARRLVAGALAAIVVLLTLAAMQPVLTQEGSVRVRTDVEAYAVFDTSRSMLASRRFGGGERLTRAKAFAIELRTRLADIPFGIASMTDRTLPHFLPNADLDFFTATARRTVSVDNPPAEQALSLRATTMQALAGFSAQSFFSDVPKRLLVVLTDGESRPFVDASIGALFRREPQIEAIFVRFWHPAERVHLERGFVDPLYRPDPTSSATIQRLADVVGGSAFSEDDVDAAVRAARDVLGDGPTGEDREQRKRRELAPYLALAAFLPLSLVLWRRNL
jgi:hypothetical protein